jgi:hypothetical protein
MNSDSGLVCNMGVFTPAQRDSHVENTMQLMQVVQTIQELENGYRFTFSGEAELITKIADFISNERLCCPFLKFTLHVNSNREPIFLSLAGPVGTQEFLRLEFSGAFQ